MKFGSIPIDQAAGGIIAHAVRRPGLTLKKGDVVGMAEIATLRTAGVDRVTVALLEDGDIGEDEAAQLLAAKLAGASLRIDPPFTGRCNMFATCAGVLAVDAAGIDAVNAIDEAITFATLPPLRAVVEGEMVATVKIIPFAVACEKLERAMAIADDARLSIEPFRPMKVAMISTLLPGLKPSTVDKTERVLAQRLASAGARIVSHVRVDHETEALAPAIERATPDADLVIVFGASAITDRRDVIPASVEQAGGRIEHFGMPVDPGNLLLIGATALGRPILGAPGCARSPKENGFDWVLQRLLAGLTVTSADIRRLGAGGLLMEIVSRPQPRGGGEAEDENGDG